MTEDAQHTGATRDDVQRHDVPVSADLFPITALERVLGIAPGTIVRMTIKVVCVPPGMTRKEAECSGLWERATFEIAPDPLAPPG